MDLIIPDWVGVPANIGAMTTTRRGGFSRGPYGDGTGQGGLNLGVHVEDEEHVVQQNRQLLNTILPAEPAWLTQVHGVTVVDAASVTDAPEADASISTTPGVVCTIQTADCLPVLFCDVKGQVVGAAHAGWRGLLHGVLENTVERMHTAGASEIVTWLGPAIGPQCFEVGAEVRHAFIERDKDNLEAFKPVQDHPGKYFADIYQLARLALKKAGASQIYGGGFCTVTDRKTFYSYRRDKTTGRMASLIWIK
ncbi:MAG: peptidoglycan editing factor PgeF [Burkholderiaceae bacterium]